jgi:hypothetical protein
MMMPGSVFRLKDGMFTASGFSRKSDILNPGLQPRERKKGTARSWLRKANLQKEATERHPEIFRWYEQHDP